MKYIKRFIVNESLGRSEQGLIIDWLYEEILAALLYLHSDDAEEGTADELEDEFGIVISKEEGSVIIENTDDFAPDLYSGGVASSKRGFRWRAGVKFRFIITPDLSGVEDPEETGFLLTVGAVDIADIVKSMLVEVDYTLYNSKSKDWKLNYRGDTVIPLEGVGDERSEELADNISSLLFDYEEWFSPDELGKHLDGTIGLEDSEWEDY